MENGVLETKAIEDTWLNDFSKYSQDLLKIQTMEGDLLPFQMNEIQILLHQIIEEIKSEGRLVRLVILKARREGISTYTTGRFYWKTSTGFNRYAMIITHEPEATDFLFNMTKRYHAYNEWRPEDRYSNKKILEFNDKQGKGLDSAIRVATAGKEDVGSGQTIHYLHLSEVAKWPTHTAGPILTSVMQAVPKNPDSEVFFESTAKGIGGVFYDMYQEARYSYEVYLEDGKPKYRMTINESADENNAFSRVFIPWFVFNKYKDSVPSDFEETPLEAEMKQLYGLKADQLQWRRWAIPNLCGSDPDKFMQEYPSNATEAFLSSGLPAFSAMQCMKLKKLAPKPKARYEIQTSTGNFMTEMKGRLRVWAEPKPGRAYVIGADVAEGLEQGDFSVLDVVDQLTGEHMAQWHGKIDPDLFGMIIFHTAKRYNLAWVAPERNGHGLTTVSRLIDLGYPKVWVEKVPDPPHKTRKRYGWLTSKSSKPMIIDNLIATMREWDESPQHMIRSAGTFDEMLTFKRNEKGEFGAEDGKLDDRVISMSIAQFIRTSRNLPLPSMTNTDATRFNHGVSAPKRPPSSAWT